MNTGRGSALRRVCHLLAILLLLAALPSPVPAAAGAVSVRIAHYTFDPAVLTITPGTTVRWTNYQADANDVVVRDGPVLFRSPSLRPGDSFEYTFTQLGTYAYFCAPHPFMTAEVRVVLDERVRRVRGWGFLRYWRGHGLAWAIPAPRRESLALFGYPIGAAQRERLGEQEYLVQYFERARLALARPTRLVASRAAVSAVFGFPSEELSESLGDGAFACMPARPPRCSLAFAPRVGAVGCRLCPATGRGRRRARPLVAAVPAGAARAAVVRHPPRRATSAPPPPPPPPPPHDSFKERDMFRRRRPVPPRASVAAARSAAATVVGDAHAGPRSPPLVRGLTGSVVRFGPGGAKTVIASNLPSYGGSGATGIVVANGFVWMNITASPAALYGATPYPNEGFLVKIALAGGAVTPVADLAGYEVKNNPDGSDVNPNPWGLALGADGNLYATDAGGNDLLKINPTSGQISVAALFPTLPATEANPELNGRMEAQAVPTGIAVALNGGFFVGNLPGEAGAPPPGSGQVVHVAADGKVSTYAKGFNFQVNLAVGPDKQLYVVELIGGFGEMGPLPGRVSRVLANGTKEIVADGLDFPGGIAFDKAGNLFISTGVTSFGPPPPAPAGQIVRYDAGGLPRRSPIRLAALSRPRQPPGTAATCRACRTPVPVAANGALQLLLRRHRGGVREPRAGRRARTVRGR